MMKKFLPVLISVALLVCAVTMPPLRLFSGGGVGKLNNAGANVGANDSAIVNVEDFAALLSCMQTRSNQTIMSMQEEEQNYVLSVSNAISPTDTEKTVNENVENEKYTSWTTMVDASASMYFYGYPMEIDGTMEIIVDGNEIYYDLEDISLNVKGGFRCSYFL